jgi:hypothetical protein
VCPEEQAVTELCPKPIIQQQIVANKRAETNGRVSVGKKHGQAGIWMADSRSIKI